MLAELAAVFLDRGRPAMPFRPSSFDRSWIDEAGSGASGKDSHDIPLPPDDVALDIGHRPLSDQ